VSVAVLAMIGAVAFLVVDRSTNGAAQASDPPADPKAPATTATTPPVTTPATTTPPPTTKSPTPTTPPTKSATQVRNELSASLKKLTDAHKGRLSVAVTELGGGSGADAVAYDDGTGTYDTASIVKVDILSSLLLRHQKAGTQLTSAERSQATVMIRQSDNNAATALWHAIGGTSGLNSANRTFGLRHTAGGAGDLWGLTQTTPADQLKLLQVVFGGGESPLSPASRSYVQGLMGTVTTGQQWGVSAADEDRSGFALKNGWLQRSATGLWDINSIGKVQYAGHTLLVTVLSSGNSSEKGGIDKVEGAAKAAVSALYS
jgi:beta-lactamase family protein